MALPFKPESIDRLKARFHRSLRDTYQYDINGVLKGKGLRPGQQRKHIFDFIDGLRLIVSKDQLPHEKPHIHFSGSPQESTPLRKDIQNLVDSGRVEYAQNSFRELCINRFQEISDLGGDIELIGFSQGLGVPHFRVRIND